MTVREFKRLVRAIPREFNDFDIVCDGEELAAFIASPILSDRFEEAFHVELVTSPPNAKKRIQRQRKENEAKS